MPDIILGVILALLLVAVVLMAMIYYRLSHDDASMRFERIEKGIENNMHDIIETKAINDQMNRSFDYLLNETSRTKEYLSVSDAKLNTLTHQITDMNAIMTNTKKRGNFGEYQLEHLLSLYCGDAKSIYEMQYHLSNSRIPDAIMHLPDTDRVLCIDSKFPTVNYLRIVDDPSDVNAIRDFRKDVKKHIKDIASKYITEETAEEAIMFVPSEAIYLYLCQEQGDLIEQAHRQHVLITSPSTLMGVVFTLINITKDFKRSQNLEHMEKAIIAMKDDCERLVNRLTSTLQTYETLNKKLGDLSTSIYKVSNTVERLYDGQDNIE
ncbi:MAG: DNA recombination protein RmuC [Erysipelotrichaceae bacterium]|nr:DNA recombination protein RmuC [Erysipelotrichaceae bacterium]